VLRWNDAAGTLTASGPLPTRQDVKTLVKVVAPHQPGSAAR
jgi:alpha-D-xyloside xylohydrolase